MIKPIRNLAVAALTACAFVGMPAQAGLNYESIARKLESITITVETGVCDSDPNIAGTYNSRSNHLCISDRITDRAYYDEVILHELVHAIQDCIGGGIYSPEMGSIASYIYGGYTSEAAALHRNMRHDVNTRYTRQHIRETIDALGPEAYIELEAYALEDEPELVFELLNQCN